MTTYHYKCNACGSVGPDVCGDDACWDTFQQHSMDEHGLASAGGELVPAVDGFV